MSGRNLNNVLLATKPGQDTPVVVSTAVQDASAGWTLIGRFGVLLFIIGLADFLMVFYPMGFGNPTWEFAAIDAAYSALPVLTIGTGMTMAASVEAGHNLRARLLAAMCIVLALVLMVLLAIYLTNVPLALKLSPPEVLPGIHKSIFRTTMMAIVFAAGFVTAGVTAWRRTRPESYT